MTWTGGGITISGTAGSTHYTVDLPFVSSWRVEIARQTSEAVSLAGSVIRQAASKSQSAGTASYSGLVPEAEAVKLRTLDEGTATVVVSDGSRVYEMQMDAQVSRAVRGGRCQADIAFRVVRKIL